VDITQNAVIKLNEAARSVLKGEMAVNLAVPRMSLNLGKKARLDNRNYDHALFARLKKLRKSIAEEDQVPPFVVFSDMTLSHMAEKLPTNSAQMLEVSGVGQTKLARYGEPFLNTIKEYLAGE
jgi:ATP-dependent DNA helicase RecQ